MTMSSAAEHITSIEEKLGTVLAKLRNLRRENEKMRKALEEKQKESEELKAIKLQLELQVDLLKHTDTEDARTSRAALKKRINDYIREIDKCIALLGDKE